MAPEIPFTLTDEKTFTCKITPDRSGLFSFWTRFSIDNGATWVHDPVPDAWLLVDPPQVDEIRMYTLIPNVSGTIADWSATLPHIKAMGFNAIHLLPLTHPRRLPKPLLRQKTLRCRPQLPRPLLHQNRPRPARRIHLTTPRPLTSASALRASSSTTSAPPATSPPAAPRMDRPRPCQPRRPPPPHARYFSDKGWLPLDRNLVLIDYEHPSQKIQADIHAYMTEYALFWAQYAGATNGFVRFDNLHSSDKPFVDAMTMALHAEYPDVAIIAEYFTDAATLVNTIPKWNLSLILATPWDNRFVPQLREYLKYLHSISAHVRFFMPITSHDSGTPAQEFASVQATIPRYIAAALLGTGATGITQGVEWGQKEKINFIGKQPKLVPTDTPYSATSSISSNT